MKDYDDDTIIPLCMAGEDQEKFSKATECWFYIQPFISISLVNKMDGKVFGKDRDQCHLSGKRRGSTHNACNINAEQPKFEPVIIHNLSGYHSHLFLKETIARQNRKFSSR